MCEDYVMLTSIVAHDYKTHIIPWKNIHHVSPTNNINYSFYFILSSHISHIDNSFQDFVNSPCMLEIKERSCFIHVDVPGHADNDQPLADR